MVIQISVTSCHQYFRCLLLHCYCNLCDINYSPWAPFLLLLRLYRISAKLFTRKPCTWPTGQHTLSLTKPCTCPLVSTLFHWKNPAHDPWSVHSFTDKTLHMTPGQYTLSLTKPCTWPLVSTLFHWQNPAHDPWSVHFHWQNPAHAPWSVHSFTDKILHMTPGQYILSLTKPCTWPLVSTLFHWKKHPQDPQPAQSFTMSQQTREFISTPKLSHEHKTIKTWVRCSNSHLACE